MSCQKHPIDPSSSAGVCASCLRERLLVLIAAQTPPHAQPDTPSPAHPPPQPLVFPRSVSPKPNAPELCNKNRLRRFHSTPHARPDSTVGVTTVKKQNRKFSILSHLFRSRSGKFSSDCDDGSTDSVRTSSASPSWFAFHRGRRREPTVSSLEDSGDAIRWEPFWVPDRGTPSLDCQEGSPSGSESSSRARRRRTSASGSAPARRTRPLSNSNTNVHGMGLCMNPNRYGKQKTGTNQETGLSGDIRLPSQPHRSTASASGANRSRKLTELGRAN